MLGDEVGLHHGVSMTAFEAAKCRNRLLNSICVSKNEIAFRMSSADGHFAQIVSVCVSSELLDLEYK